MKSDGDKYKATEYKEIVKQTVRDFFYGHSRKYK